jgi:hypothetical protein
MDSSAQRLGTTEFIASGRPPTIAAKPVPVGPISDAFVTIVANVDSQEIN